MWYAKKFAYYVCIMLATPLAKCPWGDLGDYESFKTPFSDVSYKNHMIHSNVQLLHGTNVSLFNTVL